MTFTQWLVLLFSIGIVYGVWHVWRAALSLRIQQMSGEDGLARHAAVGDFRRALNDLAVAFLLWAIIVLPLLIPLIGREWFSLLQQSSFILLGVVFIVGMAFARLHQLRQP